MPYLFLTYQMYISQTCSQCSSPPRHCPLSNTTVRARIALPQSPRSPCGWRPSLWAVIGQRDEAGEWPPWQWHCIISDRGHGVRGERGLPDTTKKQSSATSFLQSSRLSVKRSTLFMFAAKGSEVHANWGWKASSSSWTTGVSSLTFITWAMRLAPESVIH